MCGRLLLGCVVLWSVSFDLAAAPPGSGRWYGPAPSPPANIGARPPAAVKATDARPQNTDEPGPEHADYDDEHDPRHRDLQVLCIINWNDPAAVAELRRLEDADGCFQRLRRQGWRVGIEEADQLRIVSVDQVRPLVNELKLTQFPAVVATCDGKVVRSFTEGCGTPLDEHTLQWMRTGSHTRPAAAPLQQVTVEWTETYPLRGGHWSVEGSHRPTVAMLLRHLRGPNHQQLIPADWEIESWSYEELRSLHDDLHESHRPRPLLRSIRSAQRS